MMENLGLNVSDSLEKLCKINKKCSSQLSGLLSKQIWSPSDRKNLLHTLSLLLLHSDCTEDITRAFRLIILEIVCLAKEDLEDSSITGEPNTKQSLFQSLELHVQHQIFSVAIAKIIGITPEVKGVALSYLTKYGPFFAVGPMAENQEPVPKKAKKTRSMQPNKLELVHATCLLMKALGLELRDAWDWSDFLVFLSDENVTVRWYAVETVSNLLGMSPASRKVFRERYFTELEINQLSVRCDTSLHESHEHALLLTNPNQPSSNDSSSERLTHTMRGVTETDLSDHVTCVCGVVLPQLPQKIEKPENEQCQREELVLVPSTQRNLRCVALAVAAGSPVLLEGPVGCGKTSLVEHIAMVTGHGATPHLMKIQLGDQTDSKALLGTYRCTEVPGEFVWQPGALTTAVREGYWVLLEDLDYAPMDVISLLLPLLESRTLTVPGHGDRILAHADFRIFATIRLLSSGSGWYKQHSAGADILEKQWTRVNVEPLSRPELQQVIVTKHPQLATVGERLLDVYFLLSSGRHEISGDGNNDDSSDSVGRFISLDGRLISTRDLLKWCSRIAADFDVASSSTANLVFQEALDCFCACIAKSDRLLPLAENIGSKLNITKVKAEFYCLKHKPNVEITTSRFTVGRVSLSRKIAEVASLKRSQSASFAFTRQSVSLLERVAVSVSNNEPVLLVGETGTGKTSSVQYLAQQMGHTLRVVNMNQQSDSTDLLGGFKPVDIRFVVAPFREDFELTFCRTFSRKQNTKFLGHVQECFNKKRWLDLFKLMDHTLKSALQKPNLDEDLRPQWEVLRRRLHQLKCQVKQTESALAFSFIEGTLVKALKRGDWVLLDEINLATAETLECLSGLLESSTGSIVLLERGDTTPIVRHPDFRLFACMNPATDVGKKDLPPGVRNRFTELYMSELEDPSDLKILVAEYLKGLSLTATQIDGIVKFYLTIRNEASKKLVDGTGHKPCYSLRTLCRALQHAARNPCGNVPRSLYEGFCLSFLTQLDRVSHPVVQQLVAQHVLGKQTAKSLLKQPLPKPPGNNHLMFEGYWVGTGSKEPETPDGYILTPSVRANLRDLARVVSAGKHPVLLQGETSVGKTSLITWLAQSSGNVCMRINNHEHTDIQEYVGCYSADETGKLVFKEGILVEAMRKGYWVILDELNLAPTDVLEALNRLLDDNRELFIAETQDTVKAHPHFMLFATQNPPGQYGGRKILSRAFRNRFVELHFSELPSKEVETILHERCSLPLSYAKKLVAVMVDLQTRRRGSGVFAGKQGYITLRDLFRWAERYKLASYNITEKFFDWDQQLADNGYMLLAGRVRREEELKTIQEVIEKHIKRRVDPNNLFSLHEKTSPTTHTLLQDLTIKPCEGYQHIVWTAGMRRMAVLVSQALKFGEPVLLVGETGCGKTTICQLYAHQRGQSLRSVNCHLHTEGADFLGGLRPVRQHAQNDTEDKQKLFEWCDGPLVQAMREGDMFLIDEISLADDSVLERLNSVLEPERMLLLAEKGGGDGDKNEIDIIIAEESFRVIGTMNPGGDYGKKELSPALRNRFTEIWCPLSRDPNDMVAIIEHNLHRNITLGPANTHHIAVAIVNFVEWFSNNDIGKRCTVSIRDILTWTGFINIMTSGKIMFRADSMETNQMSMESGDGMDELENSKLDTAVAYIHGACMVFLDALGSGVTSSTDSKSTSAGRQMALKFLVQQLDEMTGTTHTLGSLGLGDGIIHTEKQIDEQQNSFGIIPFYIPRGPLPHITDKMYALSASTTCMNAQRVLRALQLPRPILLEGSPGVGKTSLVTAIARASGNELIRINLSEQTDVSDLFGADLPVEGGVGGQFAWRDGPLLRALKAGHWVVLDELNLASQSVLEGLNACLDHRGEVYIPELGRSFQVKHEQTRLFACQNPLHQGGGRKGLPRSFLNRFTQVYVETLSEDDLVHIVCSVYSELPKDMLRTMVQFNQKVHQLTMTEGLWGQRGGPWEFNLRDVFRWCDLLQANQCVGFFDPAEYMSLVYTDRMRTASDKYSMTETYREVFSTAPYISSRHLSITTNTVQVGHSFLQRKNTTIACGVMRHLDFLHHILPPLESLMMCIDMNWMALLVGPSASGKTSMVQLLAQLVGHPLHILPMNSSMDTTELLGGFEQMDLHRHLEVIVSSLEGVMYGIMAQLLSKSDRVASRCHSLLRKWHKFLKYSKSVVAENSTEELEIMRNHLSSVEQTITTLEKMAEKHKLTHSDDIDRLKQALSRLSVQIENGSMTRHGGTFEWIDSILVKALQEGHWLLIDNVNFCSPSVLDRLNALLEPNGVLSITERGVIDGEIPTIKPHPDFRLILAMDPRHGEISRAMRNRGLEIYTLGEEEGGSYDNHDLETMLNGLGLVGHVPAHTLITLHEAVRQKSFGYTRFSVTDLLRVGLLTVQQLERGAGISAAMYNSAVEVYVRPLKDFKCRKVLSELVLDALGDLDIVKSEKTGSSLLHLGLWPDRVPSIDSYCLDVTMATTHKSTAVFMNVLNQCAVQLGAEVGFPLTCQQLFEEGVMTSGGEDLDQLLCHIPHAVQLMLEQTSIQHWKALCLWLEKVVPTRTEHIGKEVSSYAVQYYRGLPGVLITALKASFDGPVMEEIESIMAELCTVDRRFQDWNESAFDVRWNESFLHSLKIHSQQNLVFTENLKRVTALCNQLYLMVQLEQSALVHTQGLDQMSRVPKKNEISALKLSYAVNTGLMEADKLPDPVIIHLYPMIRAIDNDLLAMYKQPVGLDDSQLNQIRQCLMTYDWFVDLCKQPMGALDTDLFISSLALHWTWLWDELLKNLIDSKKLSVGTIPIVTALHNSLGTDSQASRLHQALSLAIGHPKPFSHQAVAQNFLRVRGIATGMNFTSTPGSKVTEKLALLQKEGDIMRVKIMDIAHRLLLGTEATSEEWINQELSILEKTLTEYKLQSPGVTQETAITMDTDQSPDNTSRINVEAAEVSLLPISDYMAVITETCILEDLLKNGTLMRKEDISDLLDFALEKCSLDPCQLSIWQNFMMSKADHAVPTCELMLQFLHSLWSSTATNNIDYWLSWKPGKDALELQDSRKTQEISSGPEWLSSPILSHMAFFLLTEKSDDLNSKDKHRRAKKHVDTWLPSNIPAGKASEKLVQLSQMSHSLAAAAGLVAKPAAFRSSCISIITSTLQHLFSVLVAALDSNHQGSAQQIIQQLDGSTRSLVIAAEWFLLTEQSTATFRPLLPGIELVYQNLIESLKTLHGSDPTTVDSSVPEDDCNHVEQTFLNGQLWVYGGMLQTFLLAPQGPVDPAYKLAVQLDHAQKQIRDSDCELYIRGQHHTLLTGLEYSIEGATHPLICHLVNNRQKRKEWVENHENQIATRPVPPQFHLLLQDSRQFLATVCSMDRLVTLCGDLQTALDRADTSNHCTQVLKQQKAWLRTVAEFVRKMESHYPHYRDIVLPFISAVKQIEFGIATMGYAVQTKIQRRLGIPRNVPQMTTLEDIFLRLCKFPFIHKNMPNSLAVAEKLLDENTRGQIELIVTRDDAQRKQWKHVMKKLLFCSLHHVQNHLSVTQTMDCAAIYSLSRVFHLYVAAWRNAEQARRLHEEEKAAFYKYRAQTHGESLTEEERDQQEIEKHFPSFDQEFDDITIGFTLDDDKKKKKKHQPSEADNDLLDGEEEMDALDITQSEMSVISNIHQMAFVSLTFTAWHQGSPQIMAQELSYVQTLLSGYLVAAQAEKQLCLALDPRLDAELLGSHLVVSQVLQDSVKEAGAKWKKQTAPYDVYYDPNVPEAVKCRPLLERFSTRVLVLLEEWPDHPTLKQLIEITRRILGFPMTSPIMKFVTGLEILLQKAQEWESNAARHVSLADHMESITHQIIEWRKLELKCWQSCLDTVQWKCQQKAAKWWFHLYQLLEAFIAPPSELGENNTTTESERNEDIAELTGALKQYMEGSSLGEYTSRLAMLEAFHYQMTHISHTPHLEKIGNLLWNLQQHYQQFVGNVEDQISKLRAPIEKQLKAFVKIARWNDINYYAVKQAVEKTHKTLHRSMKAFETILSQPISSLLTEDSKPDWSKPSIDSDQPASQCKDLSVVLGKAEELMMEKPFPSDESQMLSRLPTLTSRFRKHCRRLLSSSQLGQLSTTLDEFAGEVIESVHDLQALEITQIKDKEKQKSEAKHIHLRKRRALADLFKYLQTLGLSHRKGLTALHSGKTTSDQWLLAQPLDVSTGLQQFVPQSVDGMTSDQWQGCDKYYRRCLSRRVILHAALAQPSKELGLGNIDRCKGFSEHLTQLILTQRAQLTQLFAQFLQLRHSTEAMTLLREHSPRPQTETTKWRLTLKSLCDQAVEVLHQVSLVMQCYPHQSTEGSTLLSPFPTRWQCKSLAGEDQGPQQVLEQIQELLCRVQEIKTTVDIDCRKISLITSTTYTLLQDSFSQLEAVHSGLDGILVGLTFPDSGLIHPLARSLSHVSSNLNNNITAFNEWNESFSSWNSGTVNRDNVSEFTGKVDGLVTNVLLVVQGFIQELNEAKNKTEVDNGSLPANDEEQEDAGLLDGHVTDLMHKTLLRKVNSLQVDKITHHMSEIIKTLSVWSDSEENYPSCLSAAEVLYQCTPLMALYCGFVQGVLTEYITAHRATSKLLSVLLALFSELTLKGFCLPAEFSSEMGGEGSTDFEDIEGGGLGEGEGAKDVTDQIETEDQLEDTRRQGEEKKEDQDHKEDPDINQEDNAVEMSDNFDGKLHDLDAEGESGSDSEPEDDKEHDLDREMGDLEGDEADKLDEQIWGSDDEEEEQTEDKKEEVGPGAGQQSETELVAKDDNQGESDANDNKNKQEPNQPEDQEEGEEKNKEINTMDESEYNENEVDPHYDSQQQTEPEAMDLPEEMNLDENEAGQETEDLQDNAEENPHDIDKVGEEKVEEMEEGNIEDKPENKEDENTEEKEGEAEPDQNETRGEEPMETEEEESQQDKTTNEEKGFEPKSEEDLDGDPPVDPIQPPEGVPQEAVHSGKTEHDTANVEQSEDAKNSAGQNDQEQNEGTGQAETEQDQGHQGQQSTSITRGSSEQNKAQPRPGRSHEDRSAGTTDEKIQRRLQTVDTDESRPQQHNPTNQDKSDLYEHIKQSETDYDTQTLDAANQDQEQPVANLEEDQGVPPEDGDDATNQKDLEKLKEEPSIDNLEAAKLKKSSHKAGDEGQTEGDVDMESNEKVQTEGDKILTMKVQRGNESTIHTDIDLYLNTQSEVDMEQLRAELEQGLTTWSGPSHITPEEERLAAEAWSRYEALTNSLSQDLCEQLRLVLEPAQASKLRGDYRTGKRLNMRKVIPYIASQFRKDKIWLRRTKPSKRQYQVLVAVDDSSSMADNHSKQLAFESLAVISNALSLLEVGELAVASFGESVQLLHPFHDQFTSQSGGKILHQFTFEQKKTKIAQLLNDVTKIMFEARSRQRGSQAPLETSQLLLVVSDGRGLFLEGMEVVQTAVRRAREAGLFLVFVVIDNPENKDSILDIRVPVFKGAGQLPEIKSYMDHFPFPFYIILRDINSLPHTLSDALRQWFELVTASDR